MMLKNSNVSMVPTKIHHNTSFTVTVEHFVNSKNMIKVFCEVCFMCISMQTYYGAQVKIEQIRAFKKQQTKLLCTLNKL